jgi:glyceraldehyde 3-phosphate dehydrogenase
MRREALDLALRIGINGFGAIGKRFFRQVWGRKDLEVVAFNEIGNIGVAAHLLKHDSNYGTFAAEVATEGQTLLVDGHAIKVFAERDPGAIPWHTLGVDAVLESTGLFTDRDKAEVHIAKGGAKKVVISAPASGEDVTIVMGVNDNEYDPAHHRIISNASCTTNCLAVTSKALDDGFHVKRAMCSTVHSYTADQRLLDAPHSDLRRARAAATNIIPTSSGASKAVEKALPHLKGHMNAFALRVPTPVVSVVDLVADVEREASVDAVNAAFRQAAAEGPLAGFLGVSDGPVVSSDFKGDPHSGIVDLPLTQVLDGHMVKVISWYDNEWGYSARLVDLFALIARTGV